MNRKILRFASKNMIVLVVIVFFIGMSLFVDSFFSLSNFINILVTGAITGIMASALAPLIISGGIDLSIGSLLAMGGVISIGLLETSYGSTGHVYSIFHTPWPMALLLGILVPSLIGLISGLIVVRLDIAPFIITLGMQMIVRGLTYLFGDYAVQQIGRGSVVVCNNDIYKAIGNGELFGLIPVPVLIFAATVAIFWFVLEKTSFGRALYAIGGSQETARLAGMRVQRQRIWAHVLAAAFAGLAGIVYSCRIMSATPLAGEGYEMGCHFCMCYRWR